MFDLLKLNHGRFKNCFYSIMQDSLVAKDLDTATSVAYDNSNERLKVVTLDGEIIEPSGMMSGGGRPLNGLMNIKNVKGNKKST